MSNYWNNAEEINTEFETLKDNIKKDVLFIKSIRESKESKDSKLTPEELAAIKFNILNEYHPLLSSEAKFYFSLSKLKLTKEELNHITLRLKNFDTSQ